MEKLTEFIYRQNLMYRWRIKLACFAKELFHLAHGWVHIDDFAQHVAHRGSYVGNVARNENAFAGAHAKSLLANLKFKLTINDVDPLILVIVEAARSTAFAGELENTHRATCVLCRDLTVIRFAVEFDVLTESVVSRGDAEANEQLLTLHFLCSLQMLDGFVDGFNQRARPGKVLLQNLPMRLEGSDFFEIGPAQDLFNLFQLEPQLPVKQYLLEDQELWLFVGLWCNLAIEDKRSGIVILPHAAIAASHICRTLLVVPLIAEVSNCPFLILAANSIPPSVTFAFLNFLNPRSAIKSRTSR